MRGGARLGSGRKKLQFDLEQVEKVYSLQPTDEEVAGFLRCSLRTLQDRKRQRKFREAMERGKALGRISLRRLQMRLAEAGSVPMAIAPGKNILNQRDPAESKPSRPDGAPSIEWLDDIANRFRETKARQAFAESEDASLNQRFGGGTNS